MSNEQSAFSIDTFCKRNGGISRATFYNLERGGKGPRTFRMGARRYITAEAEAEWRAQREAAEAEETAEYRKTHKVTRSGGRKPCAGRKNRVTG